MNDASAADRLSSTFKFIRLPYIFPQIINHQLWVDDVNAYLDFVGSMHMVNYDYRNLSGLGQLNVFLGLLFIIPLRGILLQFVILNCSILVSSMLFYILTLLFSTTLTHPHFDIWLSD